MRKLKILYHHRVAAQDGQSVHIQELTESLIKLGHEIIFVGPSIHGNKLGEDKALLPTLRKLMPKFLMELLEYAYSFHAYRKLLKAYREHKPDILYERYNLFLDAGARLKKKTGIPYFVEVNAPLSDERRNYGGLALYKLAQALEQKTWRAADMNFPVTGVLGKHLQRSGVKSGNITVLHNGINKEEYINITPERIRQKLGLTTELILGFTGFLREWHRLDIIIELIASLPETNRPHLMIVGNGPDVERCMRLTQNLAVSNYVHFMGFVERADIPDYVAAMDVALQPSVTDYASPLKIFEYMAAGLAIVAPDQPNIREILTHKETALLFSPNNPEKAAEMIKQLIDTPQLRKTLGEKAQQRIGIQGYTWTSNAEKVTSIAESIISKNEV